MDDYINRFKNKVGLENTASARISDIIAQSLSRVEVLLERLQKAIPVIFINKDKEGGDESIMYSYKTDGVRIGDYVTAFDKSHLVYKEVRNLKREDYIDCWNTAMCNINFEYGGNTIKAFFRGRLRAVQSEEENLKLNFGIDSSVEAYLVVPSSYNIARNEPIVINGEGWRTISIDSSTNAGISYVSLEEYIIANTTKTSVNEDTEPGPTLEPDNTPVLKSNLTLDFTTEDGYFTADKKLKIIERTATNVKVIIPSEVSEINISIKQDGLVVSTLYYVRS